MLPGRFITFEGPEGSGKTTQAKRLISRLRKEGREVLYTREPGGTPTGEAIRDILQHDKAGEPLCPEAEVFLFAASRAQLVRTVILPALEKGTIVVSDRFVDSTTAYQGYGRGFPIEQMLSINNFAVGLAMPDLTILLDVDVTLSFQRLARRHQEQFDHSDRIEREERAFHERVRNGYLDLAKRFAGRIRLLDGSRGLEAVEREVWALVSHVLQR
jgi:dTMP kinase